MEQEFEKVPGQQYSRNEWTGEKPGGRFKLEFKSTAPGVSWSPPTTVSHHAAAEVKVKVWRWKLSCFQGQKLQLGLLCPVFCLPSPSCEHHAEPSAVSGGSVSSVRLQRPTDRRSLAAQPAGLRQHRGLEGVLQAGGVRAAGVPQLGDSVPDGFRRLWHLQRPSGPDRGPPHPHPRAGTEAQGEDQPRGLLRSSVWLRLHQRTGECNWLGVTSHGTSFFLYSIDDEIKLLEYPSLSPPAGCCG